MSRQTIRPYVDAQLASARAWHIRGDVQREIACLQVASEIARAAWGEMLRVGVWKARAKLRRAVRAGAALCRVCAQTHVSTPPLVRTLERAA